MESKTTKKSKKYKSSNILQKAKKHINNVTKFSSKEFGVSGSKRVTTSVKVRKGGGRYKVGSPYVIRGKKYYPKEDRNLNQVGMASWYGPNFHGRLTANGEVYDQYSLSAAHPTLPMPSYAKVTNISNGRSVIVRVNDRGPYAHGRVIDLSAKAAQLLDYTHKGVTKVRVQYHGKARMDGLDEKFLLASYNGPNQEDVHPTLEPFNKPNNKQPSAMPGTMIAMAPTPKQTSISPTANVGVALAPTPQSAIQGNFGVATSKPMSILPTLSGNSVFEPIPSSNPLSPVYQISRKPLAYAAMDEVMPSFKLFDAQYRATRPYLGQSPSSVATIVLGSFSNKNVMHELAVVFKGAGKLSISSPNNTAIISTTQLLANSVIAYAQANGITQPYAR